MTGALYVGQAFYQAWANGDELRFTEYMVMSVGTKRVALVAQGCTQETRVDLSDVGRSFHATRAAAAMKYRQYAAGELAKAQARYAAVATWVAANVSDEEFRAGSAQEVNRG